MKETVPFVLTKQMRDPLGEREFRLLLIISAGALQKNSAERPGTLLDNSPQS